MKPYQLDFTFEAAKDVRDCYDYLARYIGGTGDVSVAERFIEELDKILKNILFFPRGFTFCEDADLREAGVRKAHFMGRYKYKIFFHIIDDTIIIDMVCHDLRNYNKILVERKK